MVPTEKQNSCCQTHFLITEYVKMFSQPGLTGEDHTRSSDLLAGLGRHFLVETGERGTGDEKGGGAGKEQGG